MIETPVFGHAAVAAPHRLAAQAGLTVLAQGGNAIEAMVATAATCAVVYPHMTGIGGDGFWLIADPARRIRFIDACGAAGAGATIAAFRERGYDTLPPRGPLAAFTAPGTVAGWALALEMARAFGGRLPLDILLADAIRHAREGVPVSGSQARVHDASLDTLAAVPGFSAAFLPEGKAPKAEALLRQPALADTLAHLAHAGLADFYRGDVAREMAADLERAGALLSRADLAACEARLRPPLALPVGGATLFGSPPPTQGLTTLMIAGLFERLGIRAPDGFDHIHGLVEAVKRALIVRERVVADVPAQDVAGWLAPAALDREAAAIARDRAAPAPPASPEGGTAWMGAVDGSGLAVSMIQSVYWHYGSGLVLPRTGVLLHNRGLGFSLDPRSIRALAPGRKPFHTLNPALLLHDDGRVMPFGTMGGDAQPQILGQVFSRHRLGQGLAAAIDAPRFILSRPARGGETLLHLEPRFDEDLLAALARAGHPVAVASEPEPEAFGHCGALLRHPADGRVEAAHDPRSDGGAEGF